MSAPKLTAAQRETLQLIADGAVYQLNCGYSAWRTMGAQPTVVGRLVHTMKLASWGPVEGDRVDCFPTSAGRAALTAAGGQDGR